MELIRSAALRDGTILELERHGPRKAKVMVFDPVKQDWVKAYPTEAEWLATLRFNALRWRRG